MGADQPERQNLGAAGKGCGTDGGAIWRRIRGSTRIRGLGGADGALTGAVEALELALLRGTRPQAGSAGLARDFARFRSELAKLRRREISSLHGSEQRTRLSDEQLAGATDRLLRRAVSRSLAGGRPVHRQSALKRCDSDSHLAIGREDYRVICRARSHELMGG